MTEHADHRANFATAGRLYEASLHTFNEFVATIKSLEKEIPSLTHTAHVSAPGIFRFSYLGNAYRLTHRFVPHKVKTDVTIELDCKQHPDDDDYFPQSSCKMDSLSSFRFGDGSHPEDVVNTPVEAFCTLMRTGADEFANAVREERA